MAISKSKKDQKVEDHSIEVKRVKDFSEEEKTCIAFDMDVNGIAIYGAYYRAGKDKNGKDYSMISFPSQKGKDGKYYSHCFFKVTDADLESIEKQIDALL